MSGFAPSGPVVLCRGARLARTLRERAAQRELAAGHRAWASPEVFPLDAYLRRAWGRFGAFGTGRRLLGDAEARHVFQGVVADVVSDALASIAVATADALFDSYRLATDWCLSVYELTDAAYTPDQQEFAAVASEYRRRLDAGQWIDQAALADALVACGWPTDDLPRGGFELAGFLSSTPAEQQLFAHWRALGCDVVDRDVRDDEPHSEIVWRRTSDDMAELLAAGRWARERLEADPDASLAIVVPGLAGASDRVAAAIADGLKPAWQLAPDEADWHVSFGRPLADFPLLAAWLRPFEPLGEPMPFAALSAMMRDPLLIPATALPELARVELGLRQRPERQWRIAEVADALEPGSAARTVVDALATIEADLAGAPATDSPRQWAGRFAALAERLQGLAAAPASSVAYQLTNAWRNSLNVLASLDGVESRMTRARAFAAWRRLLGRSLFQIENTGARVDVLGPFEAVGQRYDAVWLARLDDEHWPPAVNADPYISRRLQAERSMPGADRQRDQAFVDDLLRHLAGCADLVVLSAPLRVDEVDVRPAPAVLRRYPSLAAGSVDPPERYPATSAADARRQADVEQPLPPDDTVTGGVGLLRTMLTSPFQAFVAYRLGAEPLRMPVSGFGALNRGNLLHRAAELCYRPLLDGDAVASPADATAAAVRRYRAHRDRVLHRLVDAEEGRCAALLDSLLAYDARRPEFEVVALEEAAELRLGGLTLRLRIDRLDRIGTWAALIDYKTGARPTVGVARDTALPNELQLAVYALALRQREPDTAQGVLATLRLHTRGVAANGIAFVGDLMPLEQRRPWQQTVDETLDAWERVLLDLAAGFEAGDAGIDLAERHTDDWFHWRPLAGEADA